MELSEPEIKGRDRNAVRREMETVKRANAEGLLMVEEVVDAASDPDSAMHAYFDWDDSVAGRKWRLEQARSIIRQIEVTYPDDESETAVPKYLSLTSDRRKPGGGYRETSEVLSSKELLAELEETARRDIDGVLRRYELLKGLCAKVREAAGIKPKVQPGRRTKK